MIEISPTSNSHGIGPLTIDLAMARRHGWSQEQLQKVVGLIGDISRREGDVSHWKGPVENCPCVTCDLQVETKDLPDETYQLTRVRWEFFKTQEGK